MKRTLLALSIITLMLPAAHADECKDAQDQATMNKCAEKAYKASDAKLNELYHKIEKRLGDDADAKRLLVKTERAWVAYRDDECAFAASAVTGGSAYPMFYAMCLDDLTQKRIADFQKYLNCEEGDMSCPVPPAN